MANDVWNPLTRELDRWRAGGKIARFWLRDDDAVEPTAALSRLLECAGRHAVPVTLAVIPVHTGQALAGYLDKMPLANVAVHGWSHTNHAATNEKKQELGAHRPLEVVVAEIEAGFERLRNLHQGRFAAVLVPPWNRIAPSIAAQLPGLGFEALSVFGPEKPASIRLINTHVDLIDWHGTRGARPREALVTDIVKRLREMFDNGGSMGFLTHHLVHDEQAWHFIDSLLQVTAGHAACAWTSLPELLRES
ncbi:polysaccharide deacetylase family protein [Rhizobium sp. KVB221]|uniref:Polysaccharide deacetylase family protein n=1 Tax=Rhizobium setariae TaxID=2801340 RepID=A0A936YUQ4_9HYPH|nr:polysaccharide deacetylase family protein [Rhizobium setariae]MBL0373651.1 polysaccharide deacetylase family protein [Rhizobium setariae]